MKEKWIRAERFIGGLKFAVIVISLFTIMMIAGTFIESYYGTEFANRVVYKTWYFFAIQFFMFLSILFALYLRLPPKKRLYGFYTVHTGLILVGVGSLVTYIAGIDGNINLSPLEPSRKIILSDEQVKITFLKQKNQLSMDIPVTAFPKNLDTEIRGIKLKNYLPYSNNVFYWASIPPNADNKKRHSSQYIFTNRFMSQDFTLSLHPLATDFSSQMQMGPLTVTYLPEDVFSCFTAKSKSDLFFWNLKDNTCFTPESKKIEVQSTKKKNRFIFFEDSEKKMTFFPDFTPWPITKDFVPDQTSPWRVMSKKLFVGKPHLFLFGESLAYYDGDEWQHEKFEGKKEAQLPWMGATISLVEHRVDSIPQYYPKYSLPIQKNGKIIKGGQKALEVEFNGMNYWVTNNAPTYLTMKDGEKVAIVLGNKELSLPFEFVLTKFKMDKDPGTMNPASYESFVRLFNGEKIENHHVYMNNPLKKGPFTFYQASYSQNENGSYNSTLSANVDPGRFLKYLGSLFLVLGSMLHYYLRRKNNKKTTGNKPAQNKNHNKAIKLREAHS